MLKYKGVFIFSVLFILLTIGCVNDDVPRPAGEDDAFFKVEDVEGTLSIRDGLPETFTLQLKACMRSLDDATLRSSYYLLSNSKETLDKELRKIANGTSECGIERKNRDSGCRSNSMSKTNPIITLETEGNGCIEWSEEYDYAYTNTSKWIIINRYIQGLNTPWVGRVSLPIIVDPWIQRTQKEEYAQVQVADYRRHRDNSLLEGKIHPGDGLEYLKQAKQKERKQKIDTIVKDVRLIITSRELPRETQKREDYSNIPKEILTGKIEASVQYSIQDITGNPVTNFINTGDFEVELNMLTENDDKELLYVNDIEFSTTKSDMSFKSDENVLVNTQPFRWIIRHKPATSNIYLHLKLSPKKEIANRVKPFEGIYTITHNYESINSSMDKEIGLNDRLEEKHRLNIAKYEAPRGLSPSKDHKDFIDCIGDLNVTSIANSCISGDKLDLSQDGVQIVGWDVDQLNPRHNSVEQENWLSRKIKTIATSRLRDVGQNRPIPRYSIDALITDFTTGEVRKVTISDVDNNGNFSFNIYTKQHWYKKQRYFLKMIQFYINGKMNVTKFITINPWDYGWTHSFQATSDNGQRITCFDPTDNTEKKHLTELLNTDNESQLQTLLRQEGGDYAKVVNKLFCYNKTLQEFYDVNTNAPYSDYNLLNLPDLFIGLKRVLTVNSQKWITDQQRRDPNISIIDSVLNQFHSVAHDPPTSMFIHLLRSITTYPEYVVDNSLNRHLKYNMSFKLTPRVVRYEDLTRGQQVKGPLRDGIYVLQLAVMKNKQERPNGASDMVSHQSQDTSVTQYSTLGNNSSIYDCDLTKPDCLTIDDFVIPPTDIPILVRDGMVRTEFKLPLRQEQFLFSDSKNFLVFRLLPADPKSVCPPEETEACTKTLLYKGLHESYWQPENIANVKPLTGDEYEKYSDMLIPTYKAPLIIKNWTNWTITHELRETFNELYEKYFLEKNGRTILSLSERVNQLLPLMNATLKRSEVSSDDKWENTVLSNITKLQESRERLGNAQTRIQERISKLYDKQNFTDEKNALKHIEEAEIIHDPEEEDVLKNAEEVIDATFDTLKTAYDVKGVNCQPLIISESPSEVTYKGCEEEVDQGNPDMSDVHAYYFAKENALCILNVDFDDTNPMIGEMSEQKTCGKTIPSFEQQQTTPVPVNQESFLGHINQQITNINNISKTVSFSESVSPAGHISHLPSYYPVYYNSPFFSGPQNHYGSSVKQSKLTELTKSDLEDIIHSGLTQINFTDDKVSSFTKALCGFWFDQFYQNYITPELLTDGFHNKAKQGLYYTLRNISDNLPPDSEITQSSIEVINTLRDDFNTEKSQLDTTGLLENYYQWTHNPDNPAASEFNNSLITAFTNILSQNPFKDFSKEENWPNFIWKNPNFTESKGIANNHRYIPIIHPFNKCLNNPTRFFGFENKIIIGQLSKDSKKHKYNDGHLETFRVTENFFMNTQRDQGANQGSESSIGMTATLVPIAALQAFMLNLAATSATFSVGPVAIAALAAFGGWQLINAVSNYSYRSYEGTGVRRLISFIMENGLPLQAEHAEIEMGLINYHSCLVIRPRFSAFEGVHKHVWKEDLDPFVRHLYERSGMLLCTKGKTEKPIKENYYYISPSYTDQNGRTIDTNSFRNKPFAISLRGTEAYHQFKDSVSCYVTDTTEQYTDEEKGNNECRFTKRRFKYLLNRRIEFADNLKDGFYHPKLLHRTGYFPGVYDDYDKNQWEEPEETSEGMEGILKALSDSQPDLDLTRFLKRAYH